MVTPNKEVSMQVIAIVGSGVVTTYFGPFDTRKQAEAWAREADVASYTLVAVYPPYAGAKP